MKDDKGRNALHTHCLRDARRLVDVDLQNLSLPLKLMTQGFELWSNHFAGTAPLCTEFDQNWELREEDFLLEVLFADCRNLAHAEGVAHRRPLEKGEHELGLAF